MDRKNLRKFLLERSEGLIESVTDCVLYALFYETEALEHPTMNNILNWAPWKAEEQLAKINYQTIKRAIKQLLDKGLVIKREGKLTLTVDGFEKIREIFPCLGMDMAKKEGEVYLVAYDINETTRKGRQLLRRWLKRRRAVLLQRSLFLMIVDFKDELEKFLTELDIKGKILVTKLGKDSLIDGQPIAQYLAGIHNLGELEKRYQNFIGQFSKIAVSKVTPAMLDFAFYSICKTDPGLPPEFLPNPWVGNEAVKLYQKLSKDILSIRSDQ